MFSSMRAFLLLWSLLWAYAGAQDFVTAISQFPELSRFTELMNRNPSLAGALLTANATSLDGITVLVPDNSAFDKVAVVLNLTMSNLTVEQIQPFLEYHILVGQFTSNNFTNPRGLTIPTYLNGPTYNNRTAGAALGSNGTAEDPHNGQVIFIQPKPENVDRGSKARFVVRQLDRPTVNAQGGLGHKINMTTVDGTFAGGRFQIVDKFFSLPLNCTESIRRWRMNAFRASLERTGLGAPLDVTQNVTCLTPNDTAYALAGFPNATADIFSLSDLTKLHILTQPLYSNFLEDGQELLTFSNQTVRVRIDGEDIYIGGAKIINPNVMTNNGLMHVIDRFMEAETNSTTSSANTTSTGGIGPLVPPTSTAGSSGTASASAASSSGVAHTNKQPSSGLLELLALGLGIGLL